MGLRILLLAGLLVLATSCAGSDGSPRPAGATSVEARAEPVQPDSRVGAFFLGGTSLHTCSGSVLDSSTGDLILTAAHCVADGFDAYFVPGFSDDSGQRDFWHVDSVYLDPRWVADQDPLADFAIARVSRDAGGSVESTAGGGFTLGTATKRGTAISVTGYAFGLGGGPIGCTAATAADRQGFPSLPCAGLADGTSGSPWVTGAMVHGLTGGLDGGGCDDDLSYAPPFDGAVARLLARAEAGGPGDAAPTAFDDC